MSSLVTDSSHWRKRAAELRALADDTTDAEEKKLLLHRTCFEAGGKGGVMLTPASRSGALDCPPENRGDSGHLCPRSADNYRDGCAGRSTRKTITVARFLFLPQLVLRKPLNKLAI